MPRSPATCDTKQGLPAPEKPRWLRVARIAAVLLVVSLLLVAHRAGVLAEFADPPRVKQTLVALGPWGYLAFVGAYTVLQPFGIPGTVFVVAAPLIWPWPVAFGLSMVGTMAASTVGFSFARFVARDAVAALVPARFQRYDEALAERAFTTVFFLRLVFWMPPLLHAFFGISKVRFGTHFWGSFFGYLLPLLLLSYFGERLIEVARAMPATTWLEIGAGVVAVVTLGWLYRRRRACGASPQAER